MKIRYSFILRCSLLTESISFITLLLLLLDVVVVIIALSFEVMCSLLLSFTVHKEFKYEINLTMILSYPLLLTTCE